jgi:hypothetical protein
MRTRGTVTALVATALVGAATTTAAQATETSAAGGCTPAWKLVATPPSPSPALAGNGATLWGASVVSSKDAWFPGTATGNNGGGVQPWMLHWNGRSLGVASTIPQGPFTPRDTTGGGSFNSATDGWVMGISYLLPVSYPQYAAHWSGDRWTITPLAVSPDPSSEAPVVGSLASVSPSDAWAAGRFGSDSGDVGALVEHWNGTQWRIAPNPLSSQPGATLNAITAVSANDIWAVGRKQNPAGKNVPLAMHWDGTSWSVVPVPTGAAPSALNAVSADSRSDIWAVGHQLEPRTSNAAAGLVEHWDGTSWSVVTGLPDLGNSILTAVYAASPADVWAAVETVRPDNDLGVDNFLHWDGSSWTLVPVPGPHEYATDYEYYQLAGSGPDDVWAAGEIEHPSTVSAFDGAPLLAHLSCG